MTAGGPTPILGYRRDRVGARVIGILNVLRLRALFGPDAARYLWLAQPDGPYPDLADPGLIFSEAFLRDVVDVVDQPPDLAGRAQIREAAGRDTVTAFAERLGRGTRWACDAAFDIVRFRDETAADVAAQTRRLTERLALSPALAAARARAMRRLAEAGAGEPVAIHVRRGDILDGDPWSRQAWPSKFVPDEYFRSFLDGVTGPVIAFTDTPAVIPHLDDPRIVPASDLLEGEALDGAQRDVLEILLMAACQRIGAPSSSAFSQAAAAVGGIAVTPLPLGLSPEVRAMADAALFDRAMRRHGSFLAPGDLAQSLIHVMPHAGQSGQGAALVDRFAGKRGFLARFPFVATALAEMASRVDRGASAVALVRAARANEGTTPRDRVVAEQLGALLEAGDPARDWAYVTDLFTGRRSEGAVMPRLGAAVLTTSARASDALGIGLDLAARLAAPADPTQPAAIPCWAVQQGWIELIQMDEIARRIIARPHLSARLGHAAPLLATLEPALLEGRAPIPDTSTAPLLSWAATALILDSRLARAMRILEWLAGADPGNAMAAKRMADACFAAGNHKAAWRWMDRALEADPRAPLIHLSAASRLAGLGHGPTAHAKNPDAGSPEAKRQRRHLRAAGDAAPDLSLVRRMTRHLRGLGG